MSIRALELGYGACHTLYDSMMDVAHEFGHRLV